MVFQMPQYWDVAIDGIQIVLCLLILVCLIRNRKKNRKSAQDEAFRESGPSFNAQIFYQTLKQQVDQAFANIAETVAAEQRRLDQALSNGIAASPRYDTASYPSNYRPSVNSEISPLAGPASDGDPLHEQIQKLADKGMSVRQISEELKTPLGEVELVLSLRTSLGN
jgi:cell division protein ZapA (FtsZ GTPase activity inhibitor)